MDILIIIIFLHTIVLDFHARVIIMTTKKTLMVLFLISETM